MAGYTETLTYLFAVSTVLLGLIVFVTMLSRLSLGKWLPEQFAEHPRRYGLWVAAFLGLASVVSSLWYSEVVGFPPCPLCWFARTMLYPLAAILVVAAWRKDTAVWPYVLTLSSIGALITGYHHLYQVGFVKGTLCNVLAAGGDCAKRYVFEFGFVTLPLMGFVMFVTTALVVWLARPVK